MLYYYFLILTGVVGMLSQPALAQTPASTAATFDSLLQSGYEIKGVNFIPLAQANEIFGANAPKTASQTMVTLQKGTSIAVCTVDSLNWALLADVAMTSAATCETR
jgi:hypothetical protein